MSNVRRLDMGAMRMVQRMQANGILIDKDHFRKLSKYLSQEEERITEEVRKLTGYYINVGSPDQLADLLFNKLKLNPKHKPDKVKSGRRYVIDDEVLESIKSLHGVVPLAQEFRECNKIRTSNADVLPEIADPIDGRVRTTLRQTRQVSGRISSSDPNLMAQPVRTDLGKRIRDGFIAPRGRKLATIDQSQIEMRVEAHQSGCSAMIDTFLRNGDIHAETASRIFKLPVDKLDKMRHRYPAKRIGFGVLFGITEEGLRDQILVASDPKWTPEEREAFIAEWPLEECARVIGLWFEVYWEILEHMHEVHARTRRYGYNWDGMWGRIRWVPEVKSQHKRIVEAGLRQAFNLNAQSGAQGSMKLIMAETQHNIDDHWTGVIDPLLQVHDELLFEGEENAIDDFMHETGRVVENCVRLDVPIKFGSAVADSWGALEK